MKRCGKKLNGALCGELQSNNRWVTSLLFRGHYSCLEKSGWKLRSVLHRTSVLSGGNGKYMCSGPMRYIIRRSRCQHSPE